MFLFLREMSILLVVSMPFSFPVAHKITKWQFSHFLSFWGKMRIYHNYNIDNFSPIFDKKLTNRRHSLLWLVNFLSQSVKVIITFPMSFCDNFILVYAQRVIAWRKLMNMALKVVLANFSKPNVQNFYSQFSNCFQSLIHNFNIFRRLNSYMRTWLHLSLCGYLSILIYLVVLSLSVSPSM